jgi:DNA-binding CsgD family transcriptional regulator
LPAWNVRANWGIVADVTIGSAPDDSNADERRLLLSIKALGAGVWDYDIAADRLYCDERWHEILGLDPERVAIRRIADFRPFIHPDDVEAVTRIDAAEIDALIARDQRYHIEFRIIRPGGAVRRLRSVACVVRDPATGRLRAVGCVLDITDLAGPAPSPKAAAHAPPDGSPLLSAMERECLAWVIAGKTAWETSVILGRSRKTVEFHLANAVRKLGGSNKIHAAALAIRQGLI